MLAIKNHISPKHLPHLIPAALFAYLALKHTRILSPSYIEGVESTKAEKFFNTIGFITCAITSLNALGTATFFSKKSHQRACVTYVLTGISEVLINFATRERINVSGSGNKPDIDNIYPDL